jgi:hypothetical protein
MAACRYGGMMHKIGAGESPFIGSNVIGSNLGERAWTAGSHCSGPDA